MNQHSDWSPDWKCDSCINGIAEIYIRFDHGDDSRFALCHTCAEVAVDHYGWMDGWVEAEANHGVAQ